mmetsp:Transcript_68411/g.154949  ORF Transcript_68411/g.154949 Transcript_68411/m.154949 type:complete len:127 (-) Transcript_68411:221-601(-)
MSTQSSRTPYDHLRYSYPATWKRLVQIMEENGPPVNTSPMDSVGSPMRLTSGFRLTGSHTGPSLPPTPVSRSMSDPALLRWRDDEKKIVHTQKMMMNSRRNPFGGLYNGSSRVEKIASASEAPPDF